MRIRVLRAVDNYASLLTLLFASFFVLELVEDPRWGFADTHTPT